MANSDNAFGLKPVRMADGSPYNGSCEMFFVPSSDGTALYIGDPVVKAGSADSAGIATVTRASAGGPITGVVVGFVPDGTTDMVGYRAASTNAYVLACTNPDVLYEIQEDSGGAALAAADIGLNASVVAGTGNAYTRRSGFELDSSTAASTDTLELKIMGLVPRADNAIGANAKVLVKINDHTDSNATAGV